MFDTSLYQYKNSMLTAQGAWVWSRLGNQILLAATKSSHAATEKAPCKPQRRLTFPSAANLSPDTNN